MNPDFLNDLERVLKYGADDAANLLSQIDGNPDHLQPHSNLRLVAADLLQEQGREPEAHLLRSPHHIYIRQGKVYHHRATPEEGHHFWNGYSEAALWSSMDSDRGEPLDENFGVYDIHHEDRKTMRADADHFYNSHYHLLQGVDPAYAGHDFWLTRNGHGSGYWDKPELYGDHADTLSEAAAKTGEYNLSLEPVPENNAEDVSWIITGSGGRTGWGQPPGLHE